MARIVIAPDSFKGSATATAAADAIAAGWRTICPDDELTLVPMADGGEGTIDAFDTAIPGCVRHRETVVGPVPDAPAIAAEWLELPVSDARPHRIGVVELASVAGLGMLTEPSPLTAHTRGLGEMIRHALDAGVDEVLVALGGSASTDGGAGALRALGARVHDARGIPIESGGGALGSAVSVDLTRLAPLPELGVRVLTDVDSPLLGPTGAAAVFGPQKGASDAEVEHLDAALATWADLFAVDPATPGAGAAGGTAFGMLVWGATLVSGAAALADAVGLEAFVSDADLVITGEGAFDAQTLAGKAPGLVLEMARASGADSLVIAGRVDLAPEGLDTISLAELAGTADAALADPLAWLEQAGRTAASRFRAR